MTTAIHSGPATAATTCLRMGRLSLRKGEGEGERLSWFNCVCSFQTPHLNLLPLGEEVAHARDCNARRVCRALILHIHLLLHPFQKVQVQEKVQD